LLGVPLCGCGESVDQALAQCWSSKEQTVLLRQLALVGRDREAFDVCITRLQEPRDYCSAISLQAADLVLDCMKDRGYTYDSGCDGTKCLENARGYTLPHCISYFRTFRDPSCYQSTWYLKFTSFLDKQRR
jgi:hypothetical protein